MNAPLPQTGSLWVDQDTDRRVREELMKRVVERSNANFNWVRENMPGLKELSGRERLAFYRSPEGEVYIANLAATYPVVAGSVVMDWSQLVGQYGNPEAVRAYEDLRRSMG